MRIWRAETLMKSVLAVVTLYVTPRASTFNPRPAAAVDARACRNCLAKAEAAHVRQGISAVFAYLHAVALGRIVERCRGAWEAGQVASGGAPQHNATLQHGTVN